MTKKGEAFFLDSGEACVEIPNSVITKNQHRWENFIIAQFNGRAPSPGVLHAIVNGIWSNRLKNIIVSKLSERSFLIKIPCPITRKKVLDQGMWHIENQAMFVVKWEPGLQPETPELTAAPVWVDFHGVPPHFYNEEGLEHIAGLVGDPIVLHPATASMTNLEVARVYTIVDPSKPLPEAVNVRFQSGHIQRVLVTSQWLPPICTHCQEVGHSIKRCPTAPITCTICKSTGHEISACPRRRPNPSKSDQVTTNKKKKKQKRKRAEKAVFAPILDLTGTLEIDIGLDKLKENKDQTSKVPTVDDQKDDADIGKQQQPSSSSSSSSEDTASSEPDTSEYSSEEMSSSKEEGEYTTVVSKKTRKLLLQQQKKASSSKKKKLPRGTRPPSS